MSLTRRDMLAATAAAGIGAMGGTTSAQAAEACCAQKTCKRAARLRLSSQDRVIPGESMAEKLDTMERWGFEGLEVHGSRLRNAEQFAELKRVLKGRPLRMSAICAGFDGWLIAADKVERDKAMTTMKELLSKAGEIGSVGVINVPSFHRQDKQGSLPHMQARELLTGFARWDEADRKREGALLAELGEHAAKAGTRVLLEPLNREECYFLRTLADAASMCRDVESPGVAILGDFWHMTWEETSDFGAFITAGDYLHHVHMASRRRRQMPGEDGEADNYVNGFAGLKAIGYQDFVSLECGCVGDRTTAIPHAVELLRKQWDAA